MNNEIAIEIWFESALLFSENWPQVPSRGDYISREDADKKIFGEIDYLVWNQCDNKCNSVQIHMRRDAVYTNKRVGLQQRLERAKK